MSLSKSIDQSKQNVTQKEEEKAESTKEVAESSKVENPETSNGRVNDFFSNSGNAFDGVSFGGQATVGDGSGRFSNINLQ